ncbi:MAG: FIST C-terminal domain-containing protein [Treponema sp.]|jgi:hypothetical protein|nr:FIST C-terminal domain-containing protein [Treponema sp.]
MIRMLTAYTEEVLDTEAAGTQILAQLDLSRNLARHAVGIISCMTEFVQTGVVKALCDRLPFDVVGCTTMGTTVQGVIRPVVLTLTVLTSEEVAFAAGITDSLEGDLAPVEALYEELLKALPEKPSLLIPFAPFMFIGGDEFVEKLDDLSGGLPLFGMLAIAQNLHEGNIYTCYNGTCKTKALGLLALSGPIDPLFLVSAIPQDRIIGPQALVTEADKNVLHRVNDIRALEYLRSFGLAESGEIEGIETMPLVLELQDGSRVARACISITPEGSVVCGGDVPVGVGLSIATIDFDDVIESTGLLIQEALRKAQGRSLFMISCAARNWALGTDLYAEMEHVTARIQGSMPYHFSYSGGEICPIPDRNGTPVNRFHNDALIVCIL